MDKLKKIIQEINSEGAHGYNVDADEVLKHIVECISDEQLLAELILRNNVHDSPKRRTFVSPHSEVVVGIGNDWHATINIDNDALELLTNV